jgi:hypothetical protein
LKIIPNEPSGDFTFGGVGRACDDNKTLSGIVEICPLEDVL